jgi:predicted PurR-regulated permease PerM
MDREKITLLERRHSNAAAGGNTPLADRHLWQIAPARDLLAILGIGCALWLLHVLSGVVVPVLIALILAHVINPFVTLMERRHRWPRPLTVSCILISLALSLLGLFAWLGPLLYSQTAALAANLPGYLRTLASAYGIESQDLIARVDETIRNLQLDPKQVIGQLFRTTGHAVGIVTFLLSTTSYWALFVALTAVLLFFFSWHFNTGLEKAGAYIPASRRERAVAILSRMDAAIGDFFRGRLLVAVTMGMLLAAGWFIAAVPYWFFLGMLTGLLNIVPYLSIVSWPVAIVIKYVDALTNPAVQNTDVLAIVVWPSAVYIAVQLLEGWVLTPWIQSGQTNLSAVTIILVVIVGGVLAGVLGMLLAIPVAACIKIALEELVLPPLRSWAARH